MNMKMIKRILCLMLAVLMMSFAFVGCDDGNTEQNNAQNNEQGNANNDNNEANEEEEEEEEEEATLLTKDKTYEILFVGNSYTQYNRLWTLYKEIATSAGYSVNVDYVIKGAYTLEQFASPSDAKGKEVQQKLGEKQYDYVVIQEQSHTPVSDPEKFYRGARALASKIRNSGAEPVLYCTWGRRADNGDIAKFNLVDNKTMTYNLAAAYTKMGKELDITVAYAGLAFYDLYNNSPVNVYYQDGSHPSLEGSYTAALTIFCTMAGIDPAEVTYTADIATGHCNAIKNVVKLTLNDPYIPKEFLEAYGTEL